tara:strand:+ start:283 stop:459 length:177 start_codon:yes stop_codon:yes gene_type:complete
MKKYHLKGTLSGLTTTEKMGFMTWKDATTWAGSVTTSTKIPYVVLEMRNLETQEIETF